MLISANQMLVAVSLGLIFLGVLLWRLLYLGGRGSPDQALTDGAVLMISDGVIQDCSAVAGSLLGNCENSPIVRVLDDFLGSDATEARDAVNRLEMTGDPVDMLVHSQDGRAFQLIGAPSGAMIRLVLRDAEFLDVKLRDAELRINAADTALKGQQWEQETLGALITEAPMIAWHRTADGSVNWSGGEIRVRNSSVQAAQAVDLIVARSKLNRVPVLAGQPQKSRIEIVLNDGADTVSLHVIEIIRQDGSRIGFATDDGTAATAERTLTRFVQTMTETFAHLTVGLAIFDRNQTLALFNPALVQMWQVEPAWLARRPSLRDIIDELRASRRLPELQDFHQWRARLLSLFENTEAADYEELWHLADGSNVRVLARPHPHGSLAFIFDDVTERVRLEQRYRHAIDLRRATLDRLDDGIAVFGANGLLQLVNQSFHDIWGTDGDTIWAAMHARQLVSICEELTVETELWRRLYSFITGEEDRRTWTCYLSMGSGRPLLARIAPLPDGSTMIVFSDVLRDNRRQTQTSPEQGELILVDDLKGKLEALAEQVGTVSGDGHEAAALRDLCHELIETVTNRVALIAPDEQSAEGEEPLANLRTAIEHAAQALSEKAAENGSEISLQCADAPTAVYCDCTSLRQVVFNLVSTALRLNLPGETITVVGSGTSEQLSFQVTCKPNVLDISACEITAAVTIARRIAQRDGGMIEVAADEETGVLRMIGRFDRAMLPLEAPEKPLQIPDNVHNLSPKAAG